MRPATSLRESIGIRRFCPASTVFGEQCDRQVHCRVLEKRLLNCNAFIEFSPPFIELLPAAVGSDCSLEECILPLCRRSIAQGQITEHAGNQRCHQHRSLGFHQLNRLIERQ